MSAPENHGHRSAADDRTSAGRAVRARAGDVDRPTAVAQLLTDARLDLGMTTDVAAHCLGCSRRQLYAWETGEATPGSRRLWRIVQALGLDPAELLQALAAAPKSHLPASAREDR